MTVSAFYVSGTVLGPRRKASPIHFTLELMFLFLIFGTFLEFIIDPPTNPSSVLITQKSPHLALSANFIIYDILQY